MGFVQTRGEITARLPLLSRTMWKMRLRLGEVGDADHRRTLPPPSHDMACISWLGDFQL